MKELNWGLVGLSESLVLEREAADKGMVLDSHQQLLVAACTCCTDQLECMEEEQQQPPPHRYWGTPKGILKRLCLK